MKMNNKGYASTIIMFSVLVLFLVSMLMLIQTMNNSKSLNKNITDKVTNSIDYSAGGSLQTEIDLLKQQMSNLVDKMYPVGSIYMTTTYSEASQVHDAIGGEWEKYAQGRTIIGEAQDYNKLQYLIIKKTFKTSNYTILGDTNQTINPYYKYDSLEELTSIFESSKYITLTKTYRSTGKIIDYTNKILGLNHVTAIRNDKASDIIFRNNITKNDFLTDINNLKTISKSIAIITKNDKEAEKVYNMLKDDLDIMLIDGFGHIKRDLVVVPSYVVKGLEFDSVIIYTDEDNKYQEKDKYLFYVACTRAQHNLIIYNNSK